MVNIRELWDLLALAVATVLAAVVIAMLAWTYVDSPGKAQTLQLDGFNIDNHGECHRIEFIETATQKRVTITGNFKVDYQ